LRDGRAYILHSHFNQRDHQACD